MGVPRLDPKYRMTIEEYLAFTADRPDEERWELIEGVPVLNASPTNYHQMICGNVVRALLNRADDSGAVWYPLMGTGMRVPASPDSLPQPDVQVLAAAPSGPATSVASDALVIFEVLSKSDRASIQDWKRRAYSSIPSCRHVVTIAQETCSVVCYDREQDWKGVRLTSIADTLELPALGASIPLERIYQHIPLKPAPRRAR
jgi:Uma2 family endonuclease